jgi:hypothetical protein
VFVNWLAGIMKFETSMPRQTVGGGQEKLTGNTPTVNRGKDRGRNRDRKNKDHAVGGVVPDSAGTASGKPKRKNKCLKCQSTDHGVFHCSKVTSRTDATRLWEAWKATKPSAAVGAVNAPSEEQACGRVSSGPTRCVDVVVEGLTV